MMLTGGTAHEYAEPRKRRTTKEARPSGPEDGQEARPCDGPASPPDEEGRRASLTGHAGS